MFELLSWSGFTLVGGAGLFGYDQTFSGPWTIGVRVAARDVVSCRTSTSWWAAILVWW